MDHPFKDEVQKVRPNKHSVHPLILNRWSPRSMTGEELTESELIPLFEAARWAPSSYNNQPWRFLYARKNTASWPLFFNLMIEFNQGWTKNAGALVLVISGKNFEHNNKPCRTHSFDAGAAWMALALEGAGRGLVVHGMEGFDYEKARKDLNIPDDYQVEALVAIGKRAPASKLPEELQKREIPSPRKEAEEIAMEGSFKKKTKANAA
ncbi:MAG: nitroreductase family protein [Verrucomicrobia bacterium]|nr:nitroreductase family protein [Verrucomicrobiota bacterium]